MLILQMADCFTGQNSIWRSGETVKSSFEEPSSCVPWGFSFLCYPCISDKPVLCNLPCDIPHTYACMFSVSGSVMYMLERWHLSTYAPVLK